MTDFTRRTTEYLQHAGWDPNRTVDTTSFETSLNATGLLVHTAALNFLREFGGLRIQYPHAKVPDMQDEMHFDPSIVAKHIQPTAVKAYSKIVDGRLCPIGEAARGYLVLLMDEKGVVYASYDDFFARVGPSGPEAIETLCSGKDLETIPITEGW